MGLFHGCRCSRLNFHGPEQLVHVVRASSETPSWRCCSWPRIANLRPVLRWPPLAFLRPAGAMVLRRTQKAKVLARQSPEPQPKIRRHCGWSFGHSRGPLVAAPPRYAVSRICNPQGRGKFEALQSCTTFGRMQFGDTADCKSALRGAATVGAK